MTEQMSRISRKGLLIAIIAMGTLLAVLLAVVFVLNIFGSSPDPVHTPAQMAFAPLPEEPVYAEPEANPYGVEDFAYDGDYLSCVAGESVLGMDISAWQTVDDWQAVKDAGIEFVMIRVGYRG